LLNMKDKTENLENFASVPERIFEFPRLLREITILQGLERKKLFEKLPTIVNRQTRFTPTMEIADHGPRHGYKLGPNLLREVDEQDREALIKVSKEWGSKKKLKNPKYIIELNETKKEGSEYLAERNLIVLRQDTKGRIRIGGVLTQVEEGGFKLEKKAAELAVLDKCIRLQG